MSRCQVFPPGCWLLLGFCLAAGLPTYGWAQGFQLGTKEGVTKAWDKTQARRVELIAGQGAQASSKDKDVVDAAAQYYLYRVTWEPGKATLHKHFDDTKNDFEKAVKDAIDKKPASQAYLKLLADSLVECMKEILASKDQQQSPTIVINACNMMPSMGKLRQESTTKYFTALVENPATHPIVQLYALKALKECLPVLPQLQAETDKFDNPKKLTARIELDTAAVDALVKFIERPVNVAGMKPEEVAKVHYFRREAISALAAAESPAVATSKKNNKIDGPVAPTLLRVLAKDVLSPPANVKEKIEAVVGLCKMKHSEMLEYQPEVAVCFVGRALVEIVDDYRLDLPEIIAKKLPKQSWKIESKRLKLALDELEKNSRDASRSAGDLVKVMEPILKSMEKYGEVTNGARQDLVSAVQKMQPKSGAVFKGVPSYTVPLK